jgi:alpha-beta hydrolase superfamily lysophospholipase
VARRGRAHAGEPLSVGAQAYVEGTFAGCHGLPLFRRAWRPQAPPRAVLINLHGLGDHSGLYGALVDHMVASGLAVHALDHRGNGRSPGRRGHVDAWSDYREDLHCFVELVRREEPGRPLFLLGNSLGGLIAIEYALHYPEGLRGVIAAAPPLGRLSVPPVLLALGRVMSRIWPSFSLETGMDLSGLAQDPAVVSELLADPLFHRLGSARLSTEVHAAIARVQSQAAEFPLPLLVLHGSRDGMVPADGSRRFVERVARPDKRLIEYPNGRHVLFADTDREQVLGDLEQWIARHL